MRAGWIRASRRRRSFYWFYTLLIVLGGGVVLIPNFPLVKVILLSQVLNGMLLPVIMIFMLRLINKHELMGKHTNSTWFNWAAWITATVVIIVSVICMGTQIHDAWKDKHSGKPWRLEQLAFGEVADKAEVGGEEVEGGQGGERSPVHGVEDAVGELAGELSYGEELQVDGAAVAVAVADLGDARADGGGDAELFFEFAGEGLFGGFAGLDLAAGKLPLEAHGLVGAALADEDLGACRGVIGCGCAG